MQSSVCLVLPFGWRLLFLPFMRVWCDSLRKALCHYFSFFPSIPEFAPPFFVDEASWSVVNGSVLERGLARIYFDGVLSRN